MPSTKLARKKSPNRPSTDKKTFKRYLPVVLIAGTAVLVLATFAAILFKSDKPDNPDDSSQPVIVPESKIKVHEEMVEVEKLIDENADFDKPETREEADENGPIPEPPEYPGGLPSTR